MKSNLISVGILLLAALSANAAPKGHNNAGKGKGASTGKGAVNNKGGGNAAAAAASSTVAAAASTTAAAAAAASTSEAPESEAQIQAYPGNTLANATANNPNEQESLSTPFFTIYFYFS